MRTDIVLCGFLLDMTGTLQRLLPSVDTSSRARMSQHHFLKYTNDAVFAEDPRGTDGIRACVKTGATYYPVFTLRGNARVNTGAT